MKDAALAEKLSQILDETALEDVSVTQIQQVVELSKEAGVELSSEDIQNYVDDINSDSEILNGEQLEMVAAGKPNGGKSDLSPEERRDLDADLKMWRHMY